MMKLFNSRQNCSSSLDSPATSMQDMAGGRAREAATSSLGAAADSSVASSLVPSSQFPSTQSYWDSDFETEPDPPDWRHSINQEELAQLNPREKQRQDVINGESNSQFQIQIQLPKVFWQGRGGLPKFLVLLALPLH